MFSKDIISQSIIDAVSNVLNLDEKIDTKKRTTDTLAGRVKIPPTSGDNEHTDYKVELNAEETDKGESSTDAKGNKTTKYKDGSWQTETPTHKDDGKNPEGKVHHLSDVARRKMIKMNAKNEEVELDEVLDTRKSIKSYLDKSATKRKLLAATGKLGDDSHRKINKSFAGSDKAINKWNKKNSFNKEEVELDEMNIGKKQPRPDTHHIVDKENKSLSLAAYYDKTKAEKDRDEKHPGAKVITRGPRGKVREEVELEEKLNIQKTSMGDIIKDFQTSDAPQFAGKSQAKRRQMAIAAKMATEEYMYEENAVDKVTMDIPLLIRIMEYSKEDAKSDMDLHKVAENLVEYSKSGKTLTMACYNHVVGINEAKRPEDDSVPFITNEDDLAGHVDKIKKTVKHHFKKLKANEEVELEEAIKVIDRVTGKEYDPEEEMHKFLHAPKTVAAFKRMKAERGRGWPKSKAHGDADVKESYVEESGQTERKKSFVDMLDRISAKAKENTKLQQNRKIEPKLPKKDLEESEKPTTAHFTDPKGIKRKQPNDPFYPEYDKHEQGKPSEAKKARLGLKAEEVIDEAKKDSYQIYHPTYSSAVQHAEKHLNKQGFDIHPDDWFHHVNAGPSKPAEGKTVSLHIPLHKDGVPSKKVAHIQVYNRGNDLANNHELNMYHN